MSKGRVSGTVELHRRSGGGESRVVERWRDDWRKWYVAR